MTPRVTSAALVGAGVVGLACLLGACEGDTAPVPDVGNTTIEPPGEGRDGGPGPTRAATVPSPASGCDLLSPARVREVLSSGPVTTRETDAGRTCEYLDAGGTRVLTVTVGDLPQAMVGDPRAAAAATATGQGPREQVTGIADAAVLYRDPERGDGLAFARARGDLVTSVDILAPALTRERLIALGHTAAAGLGTGV